MDKLQYRFTWCSLTILLVLGFCNVSSTNYINPDSATELSYKEMMKGMIVDANTGEDEKMDTLSSKMKRHTVKDIFDYIYSYIFDYDYDTDEEDDNKYLICKNCTVVVNQANQTGNATGTLSTPISTTSLPVVSSTSAPSTPNTLQNTATSSVAPTAAPTTAPTTAPETTAAST